MDRHTKRWKAGALALAAGAALCAGAVWALQGELGVTRYELPLPEGLEGLDGLKIAQISDVHSADIQGELQTALREAAPDLIVFTGDLVNREDRDLSRAISLAAMAAQIAPAYYAPGNHEADSPCYPELREGLEKAGVTVLEEDGSGQTGAVPPLTKADLFAAGLTGTPDSALRRRALLKHLELPEHMSANALLAVLNGCYTRAELDRLLAASFSLLPESSGHKPIG